jgi:hypothetical protein
MLMPGAQDYATVGHLYEGIRANLRQLDKQLGSARLFLGDEAAQLGHDVVPRGGATTITDLRSAEAAIDYIVEEGEGAPGERDGSHYKKFIAVRDELVELQRQHPFEPAWASSHNPVLRKPPPDAGVVWVDAQAASALLDFGSATYGLLLRVLVQCFGRSGLSTKQDQVTCLKWRSR